MSLTLNTVIDGCNYVVERDGNQVITVEDSNGVLVADIEFCDQTECCYGSYRSEENGTIGSFSNSEFYFKYGRTTLTSDGIEDIARWLVCTHPEH